MTVPQKVKLESMDIAEEKREQLKHLFPEAFTEGKVDFEQLKRMLGEWVEPGKERFGLSWPGKAECMKIIQQPSVATLKPARDESVNFDETENLFIEGDNLEVLKLLQKSYFGKVKMIYIDPPYNTGNDFIYPDSYAETLDTYLSYTGQKDKNGKRFSTRTDTTGRYHSYWLNMMYPRLYLAKNLLREDGLIFISIDDNEAHNLRNLMNEVLGEENFIDQIVWKKRYGGGAKEKYLVTLHEYILVYAKSIDDLGELFVPLEEESIERYYKFKDQHYKRRGPYRTHPLEATKSMGERRNLIYPILGPDGTEVYPRKQWLWSKERTEKALENGEVEFIKSKDGNWSVHTKQYLKDERGNLRQSKAFSIIENVYSQHGTNEIIDLFGDAQVFPFPKPINLLTQLVDIGTQSEEEDIVLDLFAGSGSTACAVSEANKKDGGNRKFIVVQLPEHIEENSSSRKHGFNTIADISKERIRRAARKIEEEQNGQMDLNANGVLDLGLKVFKLSRSNFKVWEGHVEKIENLEQQLFDHVDHISDSSTPEDILYELLLKSGFPLTTQVEWLTLAGKDVFSVDEGVLLICLDKDLTQEVIDAIADANPLQVICLDDGFKGNDQLKANAAQSFKVRTQGEESEIVFRTV